MLPTLAYASPGHERRERHAAGFPVRFLRGLLGRGPPDGRGPPRQPDLRALPHPRLRRAVEPRAGRAPPRDRGLPDVPLAQRRPGVDQPRARRRPHLQALRQAERGHARTRQGLRVEAPDAVDKTVRDSIKSLD